MARGRAPTGEPAFACEMTKWLDTNYHNIVPELAADTTFTLHSSQLVDQVKEAKAAGFNPKPVLLGPVSYLWLGKIKGAAFNKLDLLEHLLPVYNEVLTSLTALGVEWVQIDEPILVLDLPAAWKEAFESAYAKFKSSFLCKTAFSPPFSKAVCCLLGGAIPSILHSWNDQGKPISTIFFV